MKKIFLALIISCFTLAITAQSDRSLRQGEWLFFAGVNTINSLGTQGPFNSPGDWAFKNPLMVGAETRFSRLFSAEVAISLNGFKANSRIDAAGPTDKDLTYFAIDSSLKYYFGEFIFPKAEWLDFYANTGFGLFVLDGTKVSYNLGGGVVFWINKSRSGSFGIRAQGMGKFAIGHSNSGKIYPNNHYQYSLGAIFQL